MKLQVIFLFLLVAFLSYSCCNTNNKTKTENQAHQTLANHSGAVTYIVLNDSIRGMLAAEGKMISEKAQKTIKFALQNAIKEGGLQNAMVYCNLQALPITDSVSQSENVQIKRLAKKYRNPLNATTESESRILDDYEMLLNNGDSLYPIIMAGENKHPVYFKPILVDAVCLNCHGTPGEQISPSLTEKITELYPNDKATGFKAGELRGMWSITFTDYMISE